MTFSTKKEFIKAANQLYAKNYIFREETYDILNKNISFDLKDLNLQIEFSVLPANRCIPFSHDFSKPENDIKLTSYVKFINTDKDVTAFSFNYMWLSKNSTTIRFASTLDYHYNQGTGFDLITIGRDPRNSIVFNENNLSIKRFRVCFKINIEKGTVTLYELI
jgi:hypothetical protein